MKIIYDLMSNKRGKKITIFLLKDAGALTALNILHVGN